MLSKGHFRVAATRAATLLTSGSISSTDSAEIFSLFYIRLACLTLVDCTPLAAQEAKALEDLNGSFYIDPKTNLHIVPWELRVLAVRLQAIGLGDVRRGVMGLYELGKVARERIQNGNVEERAMWRDRLRDLGVRVANVLVEMGDIEGARRHLEGLRVGSETDQTVAARLVLLLIKLGNVAAANAVLEEAGMEQGKFSPLIAMAEGRYEDAAGAFERLRNDSSSSHDAMVAQNLAVCLLYTGRIDQVSVPRSVSTLTPR